MSQSTSSDSAWTPRRAEDAPSGTTTSSSALCASLAGAYAPGVLVMAVWLRGARPSTPTLRGLSDPETSSMVPLPVPVAELKENDGAICASTGRMAMGELTVRGPFQVRLPVLNLPVGALTFLMLRVTSRVWPALAKFSDFGSTWTLKPGRLTSGWYMPGTRAVSCRLTWTSPTRLP